MKKCPYVVNITQVNENTYEFNEDHLNTFHSHKLIENREMIPCISEECGAWENGMCRYRGE